MRFQGTWRRLDASIIDVQRPALLSATSPWETDAALHLKYTGALYSGASICLRTFVAARRDISFSRSRTPEIATQEYSGATTEHGSMAPANCWRRACPHGRLTLRPNESDDIASLNWDVGAPDRQGMPYPVFLFIIDLVL